MNMTNLDSIHSEHLIEFNPRSSFYLSIGLEGCPLKSEENGKWFLRPQVSIPNAVGLKTDDQVKDDSRAEIVVFRPSS
jgi:hypothetical protein